MSSKEYIAELSKKYGIEVYEARLDNDQLANLQFPHHDEKVISFFHHRYEAEILVSAALPYEYQEYYVAVLTAYYHCDQNSRRDYITHTISRDDEIPDDINFEVRQLLRLGSDDNLTKRLAVPKPISFEAVRSYQAKK